MSEIKPKPESIRLLCDYKELHQKLSNYQVLAITANTQKDNYITHALIVIPKYWDQWSQQHNQPRTKQPPYCLHDVRSYIYLLTCQCKSDHTKTTGPLIYSFFSFRDSEIAQNCPSRCCMYKRTCICKSQDRTKNTLLISLQEG